MSKRGKLVFMRVSVSDLLCIKNVPAGIDGNVSFKLYALIYCFSKRPFGNVLPL